MMERDLALVRSKHEEEAVPKPPELFSEAVDEDEHDKSMAVEQKEITKAEQEHTLNPTASEEPEAVKGEAPLDEEADKTLSMAKNSDDDNIDMLDTASTEQMKETKTFTAEGASSEPIAVAAETSKNKAGEYQLTTSANENLLETPTTANLRDASFESMFRDNETNGASGDIDFALDFSSHAKMGEDLLNTDLFGDMGENGGTDFSNLDTSINEDINTMLPGLDNYVNSDNDFSMIDLPATTTGPEIKALADESSGKQASNSAETSLNTAPMDSKFDDMFFGSVELGGDEAGSNGMGGGDDNIGDLGDFDESWFKTDEI